MDNKNYHVISPDGLPITPEPFASEEAAKAFVPLWIKRFEKQGYYSTGNRQRIPLDELPNYLHICDEDGTITKSISVSESTASKLSVRGKTGTEKAALNNLTFKTRSFGTARVVTTIYAEGDQLAVDLVDTEGELIAIFSVNQPELSHLLGEYEFFAKTWNENKETSEDALASGIFWDTGRRAGFMDAPIWTFR